MGFTLEHIHRTISNLGRLMPAKPNKSSTREYSLKETVFLMAPQLLEKREMGCTTNELVNALMDDKIEIKGPTLNRYLCEYQKINGEEPDANPKKEKKKATKAAEPPAQSEAPETLDTPDVLDSPESAEKPQTLFGESDESGQDDSGAI